jgi:hypothetical protein
MALPILYAILFSCGAALPQEISQPSAPPGGTIDGVKWETFAAVSTSTGPPGAGPDANPNRLPLPTQGTSTTLVRTQFYRPKLGRSPRFLTELPGRPKAFRTSGGIAAALKTETS